MEMLYKPDLSRIIQRYEAFWSGDVADRPPMRVRFVADSMNDDAWSEAVKTKEGHFAYWENYAQMRADLYDDEVPCAVLDMGPAFMGGVLGSPLTFSGGASWAQHIFHDYSQIPEFEAITFDENNFWVKELLERNAYFKEKAAGKFGVAIAMLTGAGDIFGAIHGITECYTDLYEEPEGFARMVNLCADAWMAVQKIQFDNVPDVCGGYVDNYGIWTPGRSSYFADDLSTCVSGEMYDEVLAPIDGRISQFLERPWMHTHSAQIRLIPHFLKLPNLRGLQIVNDAPAGPDFKEILPYAKMVQESGKCLLLRKFTIEELEPWLHELSPKGLLIDTHCTSLSDAKTIIADFSAEKFMKFH
ncbi:MAG: hypothetical protein ACOX7F_08340 [Eubacteriales bacterium]|jgi:hypothetical protein